jgi:RHS repeat-associated protein
VRTYPGWQAASGTTTGPTQVMREDRGHSPSYVESLTMSAPPHVGANGRPDGTEAIANIQTLTRTFTSRGGQVIEMDKYVSLDGQTYNTSSYLGTAGTNFYATTYGYDDQGRLNQIVLPTGTIQRTVYDGLGRVVSTWIGTNDTPGDGQEWSPDDNTAPANMAPVTASVYDNGSVGDGNLTQQTQLPGGGAALRVTQNFYDWRNRLVASKAGVQASENDGTHRPITYSQYDNLDEIVSQEQYDGDGVTITVTNGVPDRPAANLLRAKATTSYDDQGRVFQTNTYSVDQSNGTVSTNSLVAGTWYGHRGNVIKSLAPGGLVTKRQYDGDGMVVAAYLTDGHGDATWADANSVANNNVLEQTETLYDPDNNPIQVTTRQRFHDEAATGSLRDPNNSPKARVSYVATYYDAANRVIAQADFGTNGGLAFTRPASPPAPSTTVLVTTTLYDDAGRVLGTINPRGIANGQLYDMLGRITLAAENFSGDGTPTNSSNRFTFYSYDSNNHVISSAALLPSGSFEATEYIYGVAGTINSNDLLAYTVYPDPGNGQSIVEGYTYDALGETVTKFDRNGTVHNYSHDVLGRQTADSVSTLRAGVDGAVRWIETAYDTGERPYLVTSYDAPTGGNVVNQVQDTYNGLSQLRTEYQSHTGPVNPASTPKVQYAYSEMSGGANNSRLVSMTYPNGRMITYNYATGVDDAISRLTSISDASPAVVLEAYSYLGLNTVVKRAHPQPGVDLTYISPTGSTDDAGDKYTGLDRFGRVVEQLWLNTNTGTATDDFSYGYDADNNPLYRDNLGNPAFGELYHANVAGAGYDQLNRLTDFNRGTLNATHDGIVGTPSYTKNWNLDVLGNWLGVTANGTAQTETFNAQNQITSLSGATTPVYDSNGNTLVDQSGQRYIYDAWNRLVQVQNASGTPLESYAYDGLNRRVVENAGTARDLYFSKAWQVVEEESGGTMQTQFVWSTVYVDAMVERDTNGGPRLYVQQDANWNVAAVVDTGGTVQERYVYDPYGTVTFLAPDWSTRPGSFVGWIYLHQGERFDVISGLYNSRHRDYSAILGRWTEEDPVASAGADRNLYEYIASEPVRYLDPLGLKKCSGCSFCYLLTDWARLA